MIKQGFRQLGIIIAADLNGPLDVFQKALARGIVDWMNVRQQNPIAIVPVIARVDLPFELEI